MTTFSELNLHELVVEAVKNAGYLEPTPIQEQAIPHILAKSDLMGIAQTGTGKTASFVLPILHALQQKKTKARMPRFLILEPTRELAAQVEENFAKFSLSPAPNIALLIGGVAAAAQEKILQRGVDVIIATPGRLLDHFKKGQILLNGIELLVIDEADRMLDMGFIPDVEKIASLTKKSKQTLLLSATMPPEINLLAQNFLNNPAKVEVSKTSSTAVTITQKFVLSGTKDWQKRKLLRQLLQEENQELQNAIIFCNRKKDVTTLATSLKRHGFNASPLHGDMDQSSRTEILRQFKQQELTLLVASDVAARGLDIPEVSHVFNFDVPNQAEDYVHRIGRTGRANKSGKAFTLITPSEKKYVQSIKEMCGLEIEWMKLDNLEEITNHPALESNKKSKKQLSSTSANDNHQNYEHRRTANQNTPVNKPKGNPKNMRIVQSKTGKDNRKNHYDNVVGFGKDIPAFMLINLKSS